MCHIRPKKIDVNQTRRGYAVQPGSGYAAPVVYSQMQTAKEMHEKYFDLVWYARKPRDDDGRLSMEEARIQYPNTPDDILRGMVKNVNRVQETYPREVAQLNCPVHGDWQHGFNSGMLAALRLVKPSTKISAKALAMFPDLDS